MLSRREALKFLHITGIPVDDLANEPIVIEIECKKIIGGTMYEKNRYGRCRLYQRDLS